MFVSPGANFTSSSLSPASSITISPLSCYLSLSLVLLHSSPPTFSPCSKLSGCCLLGYEAEWGDLAPFPSPCSLQPFLRAHVYAPNLCTLCFSTSRHKLSPRLMRPGSPLCTCSKQRRGTTERTEEKREKSRVKRK